MTIYKATNFIDVYRAKAKAKPINELTGRGGRPELTAYVTSQILEQVHLRPDSVVVDIGCGDGSLLQLAARRGGVNGFLGRLIGILPTEEEIGRVREHLLKTKKTSSELIAIEKGLFERTDIPDEYADVIIANSTFLLLRDESHLAEALVEIARISKPNTTEIFIGEFPAVDESQGVAYGASITTWLLSIWKNLGFAHFRAALRRVLRATISSEPFVIAPRKVFHMHPEIFIRRLEEAGLVVERHFRHRELDSHGMPCESATRWDYIVRRMSGAR
jgi:SAM-dependent methyltransferase